MIRKARENAVVISIADTHNKAFSVRENSRNSHDQQARPVRLNV